MVDNSPEDEILNRINVFGKNQLILIESSDLNLKFTEINYYTKYDIYNDNPDLQIYSFNKFIF